MKYLHCLYLTFVLCLFNQSCKDPDLLSSKSKSAENLKDFRDELPGYAWLKSSENYQDAQYQDSFTFYFDQSLAEKDFDKAGAYLMAYGNALDRLLKYDSMYVRRSDDFYKNNNHRVSPETQSYLCYYLGSQYYFFNKLDRCEEWLKKGIAITSTSDLHKQIQGFSHFALAQHYGNLGDYETCEKHLIAALNIFIEVGDTKNQGTVYLLLHNVYMQNAAYDEAEATLNKGFEIVKAQKSEFLIFAGYSLFVHLNVAKTDTVSAVRYIDSLAIYASTCEWLIDYQQAVLNQLIAFKHIALLQEDSALHYLKVSRSITDTIPSADLQMRTLFQEVLYANHFDKPLQHPADIERHYKELAADEVPNRQYMHQMATALFRFYQDKKDYQKANEYGLFLINDVSKLAEDRIKGRLFEMERQFETEKKEKTILLQQQGLEKRNELILILSVGVVLLVFIFLIFILWNRSKVATREKILTQHFTAQLLNKTEEERKRIASDLHDSVSNELVNLRHALTSDNVQLKDKIDNILEEVRNISRNLSPTLFDKIGLEQSIEQLTERAQYQHNFLLTADINYEGSLDTDKELHVYRIIQEAITNMLKHADAIAGKISIEEKAKLVWVEIKDNGKGFDVTRMLEQGNCFGLLNISERAKIINGTVQFKSDHNGTIISISIPKK